MKIKSKITFDKIHGLFCLLVTVCVIAFYFTNAAVNLRAASPGTDDSDQASDYSFYTLASCAATGLSSALADTEDGPEQVIKTYFKTLNVGSGGSVIAYADTDTRGIIGLFMNQLSLSSATKDYSSFGSSLFKTTYFDKGQNPFGEYVVIGSTLAQLGIDQTGSAVETVSFMSSRNIAGTLTEAAFLLSQSVCLIFGFVIKFLKFVNPFGFFKDIATETGNPWDSILTDIGTNRTGAASYISGISGFISTFYKFMYNAGMVIFFILTCIFIVQLIVPGRKNRMGLFKNWFIRGLFVVGGLAFCGGIYTDALDWLQDMTSGGNDAATRVVASTFCDFEGWVYLGMEMPNKIVYYNRDGGVVSPAGDTNVQQICYAINQKVRGTSLPSTFGSSDNISNIVSSMQTNVGRTNTTGESNFAWVMSMLNRYKIGSKITSSNYESAWKQKHWALTTSAQTDTLKKFIERSDSPEDILVDNGGMAGLRFSSYNVGFGDGTFITNPFGCTGNTTTSRSNCSATGKDIDLETDTTTSTAAYNAGFKMSAMALYNYLNTSFGNSSLTVYSSSKSSSNYIRDSHYAVNLVGSGTNSFIILGTCLSLLITYTVLGFVYGFGMVLVNIKRGFRLIVAVPGAMLGSLQSIAKIVSYTVLMILEILINIFLYCLSTELLYIAATELTRQVNAVANTVLGTTAVAVTTPVIGLIVIIFLWWFTVQCINLRKPIIKSIEEMADNVVQKFITGTSAAEQRQMQAQMAGAAGAGAGAGAAAGNGGKKQKGATAGGAAASFLVGGGTGLALYGASKKAKAKKAEGQAKSEAMLSQMGILGGSSSAFEEERNLDTAARQRRENKKQAVKEKVSGGAKTVVGAVEAGVGAYTGNAALAARGAKNMAQGTSDLVNADSNLANRNAATYAQFAQQNGSKLVNQQGGDLGLKAAGNVKNVEKFDVGKEAMGAAGAYIGGASGGLGAEGGAMMSNAQNLAGAFKATGGDTAALAGAVKSGDLSGAANMIASNNGVKSLMNGQTVTTNTTSDTVAVTKGTLTQRQDTDVRTVSGNMNMNGSSIDANTNLNVSGGSSQNQNITMSGSKTLPMPNANLVGNNQTMQIQGGDINGVVTPGKVNMQTSGSPTMPVPQGGGQIQGQMSTSKNLTVNEDANVNVQSSEKNVNYSGSETRVTGHSSDQSVTDYVNVTRTQVQTGGQTFSLGGGNIAAGSMPTPQGQTFNAGVTDTMNVSHQAQVNNIGGNSQASIGGSQASISGGHAGGGMVAPKGQTFNATQTNTMNVTQQTKINYKDGGVIGGSGSGMSRPDVGPGEIWNADKTNTMNVNERTQMNTTHGGTIGGHGNSAGRPNVGSGQTWSANKVNTMNVNETTKVNHNNGGTKGGQPPRGINPNSKIDV